MAKARLTWLLLRVIGSMVVVSSLAGFVPMAVAHASVFGKTTVGATWGGGFVANLKRANAYSLPHAGTISKLSIYLGPMSVRGSEMLNGVLYADSHGSPGPLLATSHTLRFSNRNRAGWYNLPLKRPRFLSSGKYWLGILAGGTTGVAGYRWDWAFGSRVLDTNRYTSGPSAVFGRSTYMDNREMSLYATYAPSATARIGRRILAAKASLAGRPLRTGPAAPVTSPATPVTSPAAGGASGSVPNIGAATWFGALARHGSCFDPSLWSNSNPTPANGYTSSDGGFQGCVPDPNSSGQPVLEQKVTPNTCGWSCEQRMDWQSRSFISAGSDLYISIPILVPTYQSLIGGNGWSVQFNEQFGRPASSSPSNSLSVHQVNNRLVFDFGGNTSGHPGGGGQLWLGSSTANDGQWHDFIEHTVFSTNPAVGEVQVWQDGNPITFSGPDCHNVSGGLQGCGTTTLHYATLIPGSTDGSDNWVQLNNYRNNSPSTYTSTFFHGEAAVGPSYAAVYNTLVNPPYGP
jgi:hypothetical protein